MSGEQRKLGPWSHTTQVVKDSFTAESRKTALNMCGKGAMQDRSG